MVDIEDLQKAVGSEEYNFSFANGRRYTSADLGNYYMPNDAPEVHRLNEQHYILTTARGGNLHNAPLRRRDGLRVLDVGCGSGLWCLQMAEAYPEAVIVGMDISPIQPGTKPAKVEWLLHDMEKEWPLPEEYFDFIHLSLVHGCVADWDAMMARTLRHLAPGSFVEHQEFSLCRQYLVDANNERILQPEHIDQLPPIQRWGRLMEQAGIIRGRPLQLGPHLVSFQQDAGLHDVTEKIYRIPVGTWPEEPKQRDIGARYLLGVLQGMEGFTTVLFTKALGWSLEDTSAFVEEAKRDLRDDGMRKVLDLHVVYSRKPGSVNGREGGRWATKPDQAWKGLLWSQSVRFAGGMLLGAAVTGIIATWLMRGR